MNAEATLNTLIDAINQRDFDKVVDCFAHDAELYTDNFNHYSGRDTIRSAMERRFVTLGKTSLDFAIEKITQITPDVITVEVDVSATVLSPNIPNSGRWLTIARRANDKWEIVKQWIVARA